MASPKPSSKQKPNAPPQECPPGEEPTQDGEFSGHSTREIGEVPDDGDLVRLTAKEALHFFHDKDEVFNDGLVADSAQPGSPCSIAAVGFSLAVDAAAASLGLIGRDLARARTLRSVRRIARIPHGSMSDAGGVRGFFYHFLDQQGVRTWESEASTIDTALLTAGLLVAAGFFDQESDAENEIRTTATTIYEDVQWPWMIYKDGRLSQGWRPEAINRRRKGHDRDGFLTSTWGGYNEALLLQILALGSPTYPIGRENYDAWCAEYQFRKVYGQEYFHCPPLFVYQFPHSFIDFRGIRDEPCRRHDLDYFENSRRATLAQIQYAAENPHGCVGYGRHTWGLSASNGPGLMQKKQLRRDGRTFKFKAYAERGLPPPEEEPDDGTLAPWAAAAAVAYLPQEAIAAIRAHRAVALCREDWSGFMGSYNLTYVSEKCPHGWYDEYDLAIEQGPIVMAAANHLGDAIWSILRRSGPVVAGLRRAGFRGGWLES